MTSIDTTITNSSPATLLSYSQTQQKILFWAGKPTAVIGLICSLYLCYGILQDRDALKKKVFRRLFLSLSIVHVVMVTLAVLVTIPTPSGSFYGSLGNEQTCSAFGFLNHFAYSCTMVYNGSVGLYYYIVFTYNWSDLTIKKRVEPYCHLVSILYPLMGATIGVALHMYNADPLLLQCYASPAPLGCGDDGQECTYGNQYRSVFVWLTGFIELNLGTGFKLGAVFKIAMTVYLQSRRNQKRYGVHNSDNKNNLAVSSNHSNTNSVPMKRKQKPTAAQMMAKETCIQSILFLLSCFLPYFMGFLVKMFNLYWKRIPKNRMAPNWLFGMFLVAQILFPLQGMLNMIIFVRPMYIRRRRTHGSKGETKWTTAITILHTVAGKEYKGAKPSSGGATTTTTSRMNSTIYNHSVVDNNNITAQQRLRASVAKMATSIRDVVGKSLVSELSDNSMAQAKRPSTQQAQQPEETDPTSAAVETPAAGATCMNASDTTTPPPEEDRSTICGIAKSSFRRDGSDPLVLEDESGETKFDDEHDKNKEEEQQQQPEQRDSAADGHLSGFLVMDDSSDDDDDDDGFDLEEDEEKEWA